MIGSNATGRRALAFADALERELPEGTAAGEAQPGSDAPAAQPTCAEDAAPGPDGGVPLAVAARLASLPRPELAEDVKATQRASLVAAMERTWSEEAAPTPAPAVPRPREAPSDTSPRDRGLGPLGRLRPTSRWGKGLAAGGLGVSVAAGALGGVAAASSDALPGESLYGVKRGVEDLRLDLAGDEADRGSLLLRHASTRMQEARRLLERHRAGPLDDTSVDELRSALAGMRQEATEGHRLLSSAYQRDGDLARIRSLSTFTTDHRTGWRQIQQRLPHQLDDVGAEVSSVFDAIEDEVRPLRPLIHPAEKPTTPQREKDTTDRTGEEQSTPRPSPSAPHASDGRTAGEEGGERLAPSRSTEEGLLGGSGVLDPSQRDGESDESQSGPPAGEQDERSSEGSSPAPDVTLPPIVPEVLPGLGLDGQD